MGEYENGESKQGGEIMEIIVYGYENNELLDMNCGCDYCECSCDTDTLLSEDANKK